MNEEDIQALQTELEALKAADAEKAEKLAKIDEANKKLYARTKEAEGFTQDSEGNWVKKEITKKEETPREQITKPSDILKADEFKLYRQGYTESEIDLIMHNGGIKALADDKSPLSLGLKVAREQRQAEEASQISDASGKSDIERKYTTEQLKNMTVAELDKILPHTN